MKTEQPIMFPEELSPKPFNFSEHLERKLNEEFAQHGLEVEISCQGYLAYVKHPYSKTSVWTVPLTSVPMANGIDNSLEKSIINWIWKSIKPEIQRQHQALMKKLGRS